MSLESGKRDIKTVVVLGSPRSGTSMIAKVLAILGVELADDDLGTSKYNKPGFQEDIDFENLSRKIHLKLRFNLNWDRVPTLSELKRVEPYFQNRIRSLVKKKEGSLWGWKDPLTGTVIPMIHPHLTDPHYILIQRDVKSIVRSMHNKFDDKSNLWKKVKTLSSLPVFWDPRFVMRRVGDLITGKNSYANFEEKEKIIASYYGGLDAFVKDKKHIKVDYDDIIKDPGKTSKEIIKFLKIKPSKEQILNVKNFVNPKLKNF